jgi:hypothetical protein
MLEEGGYRSAVGIADAEKINRSFVNRLFRPTLLAPDIQEAILDGRQPKAMQLEELTDAFRANGRSSGRLFCRAPRERVEVGASRHRQKLAGNRCHIPLTIPLRRRGEPHRIWGGRATPVRRAALSFPLRHEQAVVPGAQLMNSEPSYTVFIRPAFRRRSLLEGFDIIGLLWIRPNLDLEHRFMEASKAGFVGLYRLHKHC